MISAGQFQRAGRQSQSDRLRTLRIVRNSPAVRLCSIHPGAACCCTWRFTPPHYTLPRPYLTSSFNLSLLNLSYSCLRQFCLPHLCLIVLPLDCTFRGVPLRLSPLQGEKSLRPGPNVLDLGTRDGRYPSMVCGGGQTACFQVEEPPRWIRYVIRGSSTTSYIHARNVCMHACMHACMHLRICIYTTTYEHMHVCLRMYVCMHSCMHAIILRLYRCMCVCVYTVYVCMIVCVY